MKRLAGCLFEELLLSRQEQQSEHCHQINNCWSYMGKRGTWFTLLLSLEAAAYGHDAWPKK